MVRTLDEKPRGGESPLDVEQGAASRNSMIAAEP